MEEKQLERREAMGEGRGTQARYGLHLLFLCGEAVVVSGTTCLPEKLFCRLLSDQKVNCNCSLAKFFSF